MSEKMIVARQFLEDDPYLKKTVETIVRHFKPMKVYLFGSQARGEAGPNSDYDLLVIVKTKIDREHRMKFHGLRRKIGLTKAIDVVVFTKEGFESRLEVRSSLPAIVREEGKLLYAA